MENLLFNLAYTAYFISTALYVLYLFTRKENLSTLAMIALRAGLLLHVGSLGLRCSTHHHLWSNWFGTLSLFAATLAALYSGLSWKKSIPILGVFIVPMVWGLLSYALFHEPDLETLSPKVFATWLSIHVPIIFAAYASLAIGFALGLAYLIEERQIKSKHPRDLAYRLPSLEELDHMICIMIVAAFPLLSAGLVIGAFWAHREWGRYWGWDPKETWSLITWIVYAVYLGMRWGAGWRGRKTAYLSLGGFVVVLFTYVGVNYLSPLHGFLSGTGR